jgi:hypothetical protein
VTRPSTSTASVFCMQVLSYTSGAEVRGNCCPVGYQW